MDLDCSSAYGNCQDIISKNRKDWSLAHDVKLLKYLEKFSQNLISRAGEALNVVEHFEKDVNSLSINIQTVSQRFQSLANKQFIEHCVLEDDISAYSKKHKDPVQVPSSPSNVLLNSALSSCLSSFRLKYTNYKDRLQSDKTSNALTSEVISSQLLPPLIGSPQFTCYYHKLLSMREMSKEHIKKPQIDREEDNSDRQSLQESLSLNSSSNGVPDGENSKITSYQHDATCSESNKIARYQPDAASVESNKIASYQPDAASSESSKIASYPPDAVSNESNVIASYQPDVPSSSLSGEVDNTVHSIYPSVIKSIENAQQRHPQDLLAQDSLTIKSNVHHCLDNPLKSQSLFDDDDFQNDHDDLFSFAKAKPFVENQLVKGNDLFSSLSENATNSLVANNGFPTLSECVADDLNEVVSNKDESHRSSSTSVSNYQSLFSSNSGDNTSASSNKNGNHITDTSSAKTFKKALTFSQSTQIKSVLSKDEGNGANVDQQSSSNNGSGSDLKRSSFSSFHTSGSNDKNFSLFSDNEDSDDELFSSSSKNKNTKENFKKILEGKIALLSGNTNFSASLVQNKSDELSGENSDYPEKSTSKESFDDTSSLPSFDTSMLHSLAKGRPRIKSKRRPPSRKHLKEIQSSDLSATNISNNFGVSEQKVETREQCSSGVSVLSPSTEEEDLFVVPTSMVHEASSSNLFLASSLLSPGSSLDNQTFSNNFVDEGKINENQNTNSQRVDSLSSSRSNEYSSFDGASPTEPSIPQLNTKKKLNSNNNNNVFAESSSKLIYNSKVSLFNDTDEDDDDDLFSSSNRKKINEKQPPHVSTTSKSMDTQVNNKVNNDFFKNIFSNTSDDEDLFKTKDTILRKKPAQHSLNPTQEKPREISGRQLVKSTDNFHDPLSFFSDQTD